MHLLSTSMARLADLWEEKAEAPSRYRPCRAWFRLSSGGSRPKRISLFSSAHRRANSDPSRKSLRTRPRKRRTAGLSGFSRDAAAAHVGASSTRDLPA